jgi:hypothetical protein
MKKWILLLLAVIIALYSCNTGKHSISSSNKIDFEAFFRENNQTETEEIFFLLLKGENTFSLNAYINSEITEYRVITISEKSLITTDKKDRIAIIDTSNNTIILYCIHTLNKIEISIPYNIKPKTIFLNSENIFIGGTAGAELLVQYHIQSENWYKLDIPENITLWGKAIDDLVVSDNFLIAIDNIVLPKYILFYHLNSTDKLLFSHFRELKSNGAYEEIHQGRISPKYLGLLSNTFSGYTGPSEHITIYKGIDLTSSFAISMKTSIDNFQRINDFLIIQDKLFIAHKIKGLGIFEILDSYFTVSRDRYDFFNHRVDENNLNYTQYVDEEILHFTLIPNENKIIFTIRNTLGNIRYEIKEL